MPRYTYRCNACDKYFEVSHSISDKLTDCDCGEAGALTRVPSLPFCVSVKEQQSPGQVVKEFIEDAKKEIKNYKKDMKKGVDND